MPDQGTIPTLQEIIVTASRAPEPLSDVVGDVTVIGPQQLQAAQGESVAQIIGQAPGVQITPRGGPQTLTGISLRGASTQETLVLVDGIPVNGASSGETAFAAIDPSTVERIEILRGSASSLYGSSAVGGVVNIITKKGAQDKPLSAWANLGYGSNDTAKSSLGLSGASHGWDYSFSTSGADSRGYNATRRLEEDGTSNSSYNPDRDGYHSHAWSGTLGYRWAPGHHVGLTAYNGYIDGDYDAGSSIPNAHAIYRQQAYSLTSTDELTPWWTSSLRFGFSKDGYDDRAYDSTVESIKRQYNWTHTFKPVKGQQVALFIERTEENIFGSNLYSKNQRDDTAAGAVYKGVFGPVHLQASARNDRYSSYGSQTTGSLGADLDLGDHWQAGVAGNTGFRVPTFNDLYAGPGWGSNPNLKPEKSRNLETHLQYQAHGSLLRATLYQLTITDMIAADSAFQMQNLDRAVIRGLTLTGEQHLGNTTLRASADFMDPRNDAPRANQGSMLPRRARQVFHLSAEQRIQAWKFGAEYQYTGNRYDDAANTTPLGGYSLVNLTAAYDLTKSLGVQVRWNNVLDKDYVLVDGYNTPGSNVFVNLSWKM
ncbi:TonB-dependent receptor domain-containing protein [Castellaniella sp.]|uniref:TonB-dependent receptor domain-containing protein n=1 Tax=Castellaniella sp. TaxID=1955812 RepID=UPI003216EE6D